MRHFLAVLALLVAAAIPGQAQVNPNTLTPKEIEDGWVLLFDGESTYGWKLDENAPTAWSVVDGALECKSGVSFLESTTEFGDFELQYEYSSNGGAAGSIDLTNSGDHSIFGGSKVRPGTWAAGVVIREGETIRYGQAGKLRPLAAAPGHPRKMSRSSISLVSGYKGIARFRNVKIRPFGLKSIFNGKDLTGWSVVPDHKSVFTVTPEGWLNIKNGNGDIQTDQEWGDFVLQIDVFSNGDHLNSGVFFRANKGKFWSGYEDQIRNQWQGDDRNKAVDYGTGGIYNRLPARKVVSSDREWFKMTLVAHGMHMASWVNGYLVADFTDKRPADETNARNGARTTPGVISLQGHDPTTDLSFRNIRVVELPK